MTLRLRPLVVAFIAMLGGGAMAASVGAQSSGELGMGGSSRLSPDSVLPFNPDIETRYESSTYIRNTGSEPLKISVSTNLPVGLRVEPLIAVPFTLKPDEGREVPYAVIGGRGLVAGSYEALITFAGSVEGPLPPGTTFLPSFSTFFRARVVGGNPGTVTVRSINDDDDQPAVGQLSLYWLDDGSTNTLLESTEGSELSRRVPAGRFRAEFRVDGLITQDEEFTVLEGEEKVVEIRVKGITFLVTTAKPRGGGGDVDAALLTMAVRNNLRRFVGPATFDVVVMRDGEEVERFRLGSFAELPEGITEQQNNYVPPGGFRAGTWTFEFSLSTPEYTVRAAEIPSFEVSSGWGGRWWLWVLLFLAAGGGIGWFVVARRRDTPRRVTA